MELCKTHLRSDFMLTLFVIILLSFSAVFASDPQNGTVTRRVLDSNPVNTPATNPVPQKRKASTGGQGYRIIMQGHLMNWVNGMLNRIKPHLDRVKSKGINYRIRIIDDPSVNAMTLADGRIYLTKGLLKFIKTDDELASVIAHECGHVEMKHHQKRAKKQSIWTALAVLGAALSKADGEGFLGAQLLGSLATMSYSRNQEHEADRVGADYCEAAGYNPTASVDFIERLLKKEQEKEKDGKAYYKLSPIFNTHPPSHARAVKVSEQLKGKGPFPPKMLSFNPGRLFYAPMKWSDKNNPLSQKSASPDNATVKAPLFIHEDFEDSLVVLPVEEGGLVAGAWYLEGNGAWRQVSDKVAIGRKSLKLWSSGKGPLTFETYQMNLPQSLINTVLEVIVSGDAFFNVNMVAILHGSSGQRKVIPLKSTIEGEQGGWRLFRVSDFSPVNALIKDVKEEDNPYRSLSLGWLFPDGVRGAMYIDELRFGNTPELRILDSNSIFENSITKSGKEIFEGWDVLRGTGDLVAASNDDKEIAGTHHFTLSPPAGGRYATLVSGPVDAARLRGGYMLYFNAKATDGVRLFAGLDYRSTIVDGKIAVETSEHEGDGDARAGEWKPAGNTSINKRWKRLRLISDEKPVNNGTCRVRFEFSSTKKDFKVFIDEVILVSLLKPNAP